MCLLGDRSRFFKQSKFTSFQRQLNLYGFQRVTSGRDRQAYYHPLLLRGRPDLCRLMLRTRVKGGGLLFAGAATTNPSSSCPLSVLLSGELGVPEQKTSQGRSNAKRKQHAISFYDLPQCNTNNNTYIETVSSRASHVSSSDDDDESTDLNGRRLPVVKRSKPNSPIATPIVSESFVAASVHVPCVPDAVAASECNSSMLSTVTPRLMDNNTPNLVRSSSTSSLSSLDGSYPLAPIQSATWELLPNDACSSSSWPETTTPSLHHVIYRSGNRAHSATSHAIYHETTLQSAGEIHGEYSPLGGIGCAFSADAVKNNHGLPSVAPFSNSSNDCSVSCGKSQCFGVFEGQPFLFVDDENLRLYESNVIGECG